jgi:Amt family ammonium transporter
MTNAAATAANEQALNDPLSEITFILGWTFAASGTSIMSGVVAERMKYEAFLIVAFLHVALIYPIIVHSNWSADGWAYVGKERYGWHCFSRYALPACPRPRCPRRTTS